MGRIYRAWLTQKGKPYRELGHRSSNKWAWRGRCCTPVRNAMAQQREEKKGRKRGGGREMDMKRQVLNKASLCVCVCVCVCLGGVSGIVMVYGCNRGP